MISQREIEKLSEQLNVAKAFLEKMKFKGLEYTGIKQLLNNIWG